MRYKITIEYDGTNYKGWQSQDGLPTVQGAIESAVFAFCQEKTEVYGSGRTDAGVHALGMTAHMDIQKETDTETIKMALNAHLREEAIVILSVEKTADEFHARFDAKQRYYLYRILNRATPPALDVDRVWWVPQKLDIEKMRAGAKHLIGQHDFSSFRAAECQAQSPIRTVDEITFEKQGNEIWMRCQARSFLHHQIRNFIGSLVEVGRGKEEPIWIKEILEKKDRTTAGPTAPACGLYFEKVEY
ncbi:MAG: tRNA pseudouridine(38-40) synthase TruA [Alphaproteobacteria bacterium]|nr:tRNA pseudouridine(38-40) synthase TruA [Alphaproteobacteria bacterium]MBN2780118.1 tRNA pseudouridine(38-40) synthase TruA [Alphaproteobacteria bacterium]